MEKKVRTKKTAFRKRLRRWNVREEQKATEMNSE